MANKKTTPLYRIRSDAPKLPRFPRRQKPAPKKLRKVVPIPSTRKLIKESWQFLWQNRKKLGGVLLIYAVLYMLFVTGLSGNLDLASIQHRLEAIFGNNKANSLIATGVVLVSVGSASTSTQQLYQTLLPFVGTLAIIWSIRRLLAKQPFRLRDAYYRSMQPFFPLVLVELTILIKLLPFIIGAFIYVTVKQQQLAVDLTETIFFITLLISSFVLSLYLIVPNVLAIYAVSLPDVYPRQAILATKHMVRGQRMKVLGRLVAGVAIGLVVVALIVLAAIAWWTTIVPALTLACTLVGFLAFHVYAYHVYRSML